MSDMVSRQAVLKLLSAMPPEEATTKAMLIQSVKQMDAAQPEKRTDKRTEIHACDLISRAEAIEAVHNEFDGCLVWDESGKTTANEVERIIASLPSAQPEIIRCCDCKHYYFADNRAFGFPAKRCEWTGFEDVDDDDFCSRAERREVNE